MKRLTKLVSVITAVLSLVVFSPYSHAEDIEKLFPEKLILNYDNGGIKKEEAVYGYSIDYDGYPAYRLSRMQDDEFKRRINTETLNSSYDSYPIDQNNPRPLIYSITKVPFNKEYSSSSNKFTYSDLGMPTDVEGTVSLGAAFIINLAVHEFGHAIVADYVGASGSSLGFFSRDGGQFFLGMSSVNNIDNESVLPYTMGGEFFVDLTFEHALQYYRRNPNKFNKSLLFYSGTDFLWYCLYAFYLSEGNPHYDPITVSEETGISRDMLFSVVLAKTMINTYRVYTGRDTIIPYFMVDKDSTSLNVMIPF